MLEPIIPCERCGKPDAQAHRGWQLLCPRCIRADESEFWDDSLHLHPTDPAQP